MQRKIYLFLIFISAADLAFGQVQKLNLKEALSLAATNNKIIQAKKLGVHQSEEALNETRSFLKPTVSATAQYLLYAERPVIFLRDNAAGKTVNATKVGGTNALSAGVAGTYPLYQPSLHNNVRLAQIQTQIEKEELGETTNDVHLKVAFAYYTILYYNEQLRLYQQSLLRNEHALTDAKALYLQAKGLKTDTLRTYIDVQNVQATISSLTNKMQLRVLELKYLVGLNDDAQIELTDNLSTNDDNVLNGLLLGLFAGDNPVSVAMHNRTEVKLLQLHKDANVEENRKVKSEQKPSLHGVAHYQLQSQSDRFSFWNYTLPRTSFIGVQLQVPVYSGKKEKYRAAKYEYAIKKAESELADLKQNIALEIHSILENIRDASLQKEIQNRNVEAALVSYNLVNDRYKNGLSSRLDLADSEAALTNARLNELYAVYNLRIWEFQLERAMGVINSNR